MVNSSRLTSGDTAPTSGEYEVIGSRGGRTGKTVTMKKGDTLPPTPLPDQYYEKVK